MKTQWGIWFHWKQRYSICVSGKRILLSWVRRELVWLEVIAICWWVENRGYLSLLSQGSETKSYLSFSNKYSAYLSSSIIINNNQ